jgi:hypothetical protein
MRPVPCLTHSCVLFSMDSRAMHRGNLTQLLCVSLPAHLSACACCMGLLCCVGWHICWWLRVAGTRRWDGQWRLTEQLGDGCSDSKWCSRCLSLHGAGVCGTIPCMRPCLLLQQCCVANMNRSWRMPVTVTCWCVRHDSLRGDGDKWQQVVYLTC